jgi:hypothetical protein
MTEVLTCYFGFDCKGPECNNHDENGNPLTIGKFYFNGNELIMVNENKPIGLCPGCKKTKNNCVNFIKYGIFHSVNTQYPIMYDYF